jgi:hypothetical protein
MSFEVDVAPRFDYGRSGYQAHLTKHGCPPTVRPTKRSAR